jgi:hypothetical protein
MPNVLKLFRSKHNKEHAQELRAEKCVVNKGPSNVFRRKGSAFRRSNIKTNNKVELTLSSDDQPSISENLTWTTSQDEAEEIPLSTFNTEYLSIGLTAAVNEPNDPILPEESDTKTLSFTEKELMDNQLNHIRSLSKLETEVAELKYAIEVMAKKHEAEVYRKDDEYVELLIKVRETEQQLKEVKGELGDVKEELGVVVATLMDIQRKHYETAHKQDSGFWSSFSYF